MPAKLHYGMNIANGIAAYGTTGDGKSVRKLVLGTPGGIQVELIEYGATLTAIRVPHRGGLSDILLGYDSLAAYEAGRSYMGAIVGRYANRIGGAQFHIDGTTSHVTANEGANCLHGGRLGLSKRVWVTAGADEQQATLTYRSPAGEEGFPGCADLTVTFTVTGDSLIIDYAAQVTAATPLNLCHHPYFNLSADWQIPILNHELMIAADAITPVGPGLIPTGEIRQVAGTAFDLRQPQRIGGMIVRQDPQLACSRGHGIYDGYDHNWVLRRDAVPAVQLRSPESGLQLEIGTTQPGVQVYTSQLLEDPAFMRYAGVVLEPQNFPDAPNRPEFPESIIRPGEPYRQRTIYRFTET